MIHETRDDVDARMFRASQARARPVDWPSGALDTSRLGPVRIEAPNDRTPKGRAREAFAAMVAAQGPSYRNAADSIRAGWENIWIRAGIAALADAYRLIEDDA